MKCFCCDIKQTHSTPHEGSKNPVPEKVVEKYAGEKSTILRHLE